MTQEQFLQILPAYSGCLINYQIGKARFVGWIPRSDNNAYGTMHFTDGWANIQIKECKLILRSFDQMTDEEIFKYKSLELSITDMMKVQGCIFPMKLAKVQEQARKINYLRSIGVDCDGLIEAGWAIKEEGK